MVLKKIVFLQQHVLNVSKKRNIIYSHKKQPFKYAKEKNKCITILK